MTKEEAIVIQKAIRENLHETGKDFPYHDGMIPLMKESCDMAIKALEKEPCEDAISRQAVDVLVDELARVISDEKCGLSRGRSTATIMEDILRLSSVTPKGVTVTDFADKCRECGREKVLDKIKAEIEKLNHVNYGSMYSYESHRGARDMKNDILAIIDKYNSESEVV